jgi:predicted KAP-like P-loop ATPase
MDGDRPVERPEDDRLGFAPIARHLAKAISDLPATEGFVFGIEGKWGSGKTTLINLTIAELTTNDEAKPEMVSFAPWLVGTRDGLLQALFDELAAAAIKIDPIDTALSASSFVQRWTRTLYDSHWKLRQKEKLRNALAGKLKTFGNVVGSFGKVASIAAAAGMPMSGVVAGAAARTSETANQFLTNASVTKRKSELVNALKVLSRRIVVFIDDLDRLEPRDVSEILRLIRAVADFPNVIYVLSYDPEVVAHALSKSLGLDSGETFLEKMVQVSFQVPRPEEFDLRRWFWSEVEKLFDFELGEAGEKRKPLEQRLSKTIDVQGGRYLQTARDVVRVLNALRLRGLPVRELVDIPDMVWLQLVRIGNPKLYKWTEEYLTGVAAVSQGASMTEGGKRSMAKRIEQLVAEGDDPGGFFLDIAEYVPGLDAGLDGSERHLFKLNDSSMHRIISEKRLGSPEHYRYYFAFSLPAGSLADAQVEAFIELAETKPADALDMFRALVREVRPQGGTKADVLIDRLVIWSNRVHKEAIPGIFTTFAKTMDEIAQTTPAGDFGEHYAWRTAKSAVKLLLKRTAGELRAKCLSILFERGGALGWLTDILRTEIFSQGFYGDHPDPVGDRTLSVEEFHDVLNIMLNRYRETRPAELMQVPQFLSLLYAWKQGGGDGEVEKWVSAQTARNAGLLSFLSRVRSWRASSGAGIQYPLKRRDLENFLDFDAALKRLETISSSTEASEPDRRLAHELLIAAKQDRDFGE